VVEVPDYCAPHALYDTAQSIWMKAFKAPPLGKRDLPLRVLDSEQPAKRSIEHIVKLRFQRKIADESIRAQFS
jgi:hypothetical protein